MPRRWSNSFNGSGGNVSHRFVEDAPIATINGKGFPVNLRYVDNILAVNAKIAGKEARNKKPR